MKLPRRILIVLALAGGLVLPVTAAAAAPAPVPPAPAANYQMYGTSCADSPCGSRVTAFENPNNAAYRAETDCSNGTILFGGWKTGTGNQSATGQCPNGSHATSAWEDYNMAHNYTQLCWVKGENWNGVC